MRVLAVCSGAIVGECLVNSLLANWVFSFSPENTATAAILTVLLNSFGCLLEPFSSPQFDRATGFGSGFLSVLTSFPDIGDGGCALNNLALGGCYCLFAFGAGITGYLWGRDLRKLRGAGGRAQGAVEGVYWWVARATLVRFWGMVCFRIFGKYISGFLADGESR